MATRQEIVDALFNRPVKAQCYPATVVSVSGNTCAVNAWDEIEIESVKLLAYTQADEGFWLIPKVGSAVIVLAIDNDISNACVVQCSEIDRIESLISGTKLKVDKDGFTFEKGSAFVEIRQNELSLSQDGATVSLSGRKVSIEAGGVNLKSWLSDLVQALTTFAVTTSTGPALPAPTTITTLTQLSTQIALLLK